MIKESEYYLFIIFYLCSSLHRNLQYNSNFNLCSCHVTQSAQQNKLGKFFWLNFLKKPLMFLVTSQYPSKCASFLYSTGLCVATKSKVSISKDFDEKMSKFFLDQNQSLQSSFYGTASGQMPHGERVKFREFCEINIPVKF